MTFLARLFDLCVSQTVERNRQPGACCATCQHFIDYRETETDPEEVNGYCGELVDRLGLTEAVKVNEYGGHWTHSESWCSQWEGGDPIWVTERPAPDPKS